MHPPAVGPPPRGHYRVGWLGDGFLALLTLAANLAVFLVFSLSRAFSGFGSGRPCDSEDPECPEVPSVDWSPVVTISVLALCAVLAAVALWRHGPRLTSTAQSLGALILCFTALHAGIGEWERAHPRPDPAPTAPSGSRCVCHSAGGSCRGDCGGEGG
ncbi:DUF6234 family protein [Streptomyces sp. NPDC051940]|uniref:DUF6234 family protein n=1 Tax=Streptomyces sp. NPDC051940 TaxID=3155675 RepID=UPI0034260BCE